MNKNLDIEEIIQQGYRNTEIIRNGGFARCPITNKPLRVNYYQGRFCWDSPHTQKAHLISNSKAMRKKYGNEIIDHEFNWIFVAGLEANNAIQIKNRPVLESEIIARITTDLLRSKNC